MNLIPSLRAKCTPGSGPDLSKYPRLTHAPQQWGEGVRVASNGKEVDTLVSDPVVTFAVQQLERAVAAQGVTLHDLFDAIRYARDQAR